MLGELQDILRFHGVAPSIRAVPSREGASFPLATVGGLAAAHAMRR
jgi:hypothetical protein